MTQVMPATAFYEASPRLVRSRRYLPAGGADAATGETNPLQYGQRPR